MSEADKKWEKLTRDFHKHDEILPNQLRGAVEASIRELQVQTDVPSVGKQGPAVGVPVTVWKTWFGGFQVVFNVDGHEFCLSATRSTRKGAEEIAVKLREVLR